MPSDKLEIFGAPTSCEECGNDLVFIRPDYPEHLSGPLCPSCDMKDVGFYLDWLNQDSEDAS